MTSFFMLLLFLLTLIVLHTYKARPGISEEEVSFAGPTGAWTMRKRRMERKASRSNKPV